jgi:hypothetical protein
MELQEGPVWSLNVVNEHGDTLIEATNSASSDSTGSYFESDWDISNSCFDNKRTKEIIDKNLNEFEFTIEFTRDGAIELIIDNKYYDDYDGNDYLMKMYDISENKDYYQSILELENYQLEKIINDEWDE